MKVTLPKESAVICKHIRGFESPSPVHQETEEEEEIRSGEDEKLRDRASNDTSTRGNERQKNSGRKQKKKMSEIRSPTPSYPHGLDDRESPAATFNEKKKGGKKCNDSRQGDLANISVPLNKFPQEFPNGNQDGGGQRRSLLNRDQAGGMNKYGMKQGATSQYRQVLLVRPPGESPSRQGVVGVAACAILEQRKVTVNNGWTVNKTAPKKKPCQSREGHEEMESKPRKMSKEELEYIFLMRWNDEQVRKAADAPERESASSSVSAVRSPDTRYRKQRLEPFSYSL
jgi:hypothetical protein